MLNSSHSEVWNNVFSAYMQYPIIIGGEQRTDTNIITNSKHNLMAKSGAEGVLFVSDKKVISFISFFSSSKSNLKLCI